MSDALVDIHVGRVADAPWLAWAEGQTFCVPRSVADALAPLQNSSGQVVFSGAVAAANLQEQAEQLRLYAAFTVCKPTSSKLPISYQSIPQVIRTQVGKIIGRVERHRERNWARFPRWPLDLSADFIADLSRPQHNDVPKQRTPVILSHDLDTAEGLSNVRKHFLDIEEHVGARSTNYIVPCGWPIDRAVLDEVHARGHEIGIHGYDHSNKTPFVSSTERRERLDAAVELMETYAIRGYRAPSLVRTEALLDDLSRLYQYDSSVPTSGGRFPVPNNGCATARVFRLRNIIEIPLSMPRDGSLRFLGHTPEHILDLWKRCARAISHARGTVTLLTHCEERFSGNKQMLDVYARLLEFFREDEAFTFTTASAVAHDSM